MAAFAPQPQSRKPLCDNLPDFLAIHEVQVTVNASGFRSQPLVTVTLLRDHTDIPRADLAALYRRRWLIGQSTTPSSARSFCFPRSEA